MFTNRSVRSLLSARVAAVRMAATVLQTLALCATLAVVHDAWAAEKIGAADRRAIEQTLRRQLDAFLHDDADRAFAYATPDIRRMFGSSDSFMEMVRDRYEPVYRASSVAFIGIESVDGQWVQTVRIVDGEGRVWRALFTMKRQPDKSWKVGGCQLVQTSAITT